MTEDAKRRPASDVSIRYRIDGSILIFPVLLLVYGNMSNIACIRGCFLVCGCKGTTTFPTGQIFRQLFSKYFRKGRERRGGYTLYNYVCAHARGRRNHGRQAVRLVFLLNRFTGGGDEDWLLGTCDSLEILSRRAGWKKDCKGRELKRGWFIREEE